MSQKHIGRDSLGEISGPHGVLKYRDISVGFVPKDETASDAAVWGCRPLKCVLFGDMMESVDVSDSKSDDREVVWVRVPLSPPRGY